MLGQLGLLLTFQLAGELIVTAIGIPFPGPLCGMVLLLGYLYLRGGAPEALFVVGSKLTDNLGLLFVPAGAAIVAYDTLIAQDGLAIAAALMISTLLAIFVSGVVAEKLSHGTGSIGEAR
jgi:holin-like protein